MNPSLSMPSFKKQTALAALVCLLALALQLGAPIFHGLQASHDIFEPASDLTTISSPTAGKTSPHHHDTKSCFICRTLTTLNLYSISVPADFSVALHQYGSTVVSTVEFTAADYFSPASPRAPPASI